MASFLPRHRPPPPLRLLLAVLVAGGAFQGAPSASGAESKCLERPQSCGTVNISYPFYLSEDTGNNTSYCGYPGLRIECEDGVAVMELPGGKYNVSDINYENFIVSLADQEVREDETCPTVDHNVTFPHDSWLLFPDTTDYLVFFLNCSFTSGFVKPSNIDPIGCDVFNSLLTTGQYSYVVPRRDLSVEGWWGACQRVFDAPVLKHNLPANSLNDAGWRNGGFSSVLRAGFQVAWDSEARKRSACAQCEGSKGQCGYNQTGQFVGCFCPGEQAVAQNCTTISSGSSNQKGVIIGVSAAAAVGIMLVAAIFLFIRKSKQKKVINSSSKLLKYSGSGGTPQSRGGDMESGSIQDLQTHLFSYEELEEATDSFNDNRELGDGGFGTVYKGFLKDGRVVAVKRLYNNSYRRVEQFVNEAAILSRLRHPNLVMFYGCTSSHSRELLLVYEFVANGTVADHLHGHRAGERALSWPLRLAIAVESAAALTYLHAIEPPIVHRDVKTTNILLDSDFHVKVADFGLSRLFPLDVTHVSTAPQGTPGYVDPEYHQCYQLTDKSDVYSFGVVLIELISSKPAVDITRHRNEINLAGMAISKIQKCQLEELVDLDLGYESDPATKKMMTMVAELAFRCLQHNGEMRPPIKEVLEVLKSIQGECRMAKDADKDPNGPFSPNTVHAPWDSRATTPNTSQ